MGFVKICPTCGKKNSIDELFCSNDGVDISDMSPVDENDIVEKEQCDNGNIRVCPSCGEKNPVKNTACLNCSWSLEDVPLVDDHEPPVDACKIDHLIINLPNGQKFRVMDGDIIGRNCVGGEILDRTYKTVSGIHAKITSNGCKWFIEDLGSTNGTYINNARIQPNTKVEIISGQRISISKSCVIVISNDT